MVGDLVFAAPGKLATLTGGYAYDRRIIKELGALGWRVETRDLGEGFPLPSAPTRARAQALLAASADNSLIVVDGLAFGALPEAAERLCADHRLIALVHHPLAMESGLSPSDAEALFVSERRALAAARSVIVTSDFTARLIAAKYGVPVDRITSAPPGSDAAPRSKPDAAAPVMLLAVGAVVPRKGYDALIAAAARILDLPWRLVIVGDRSRDPAAAARLDADIARFGLAHRVDVVGAVPGRRLEAFYRGASVFVSASHFEGYGMALAEAVAHGLPIVATTAGASVETAPAEAAIFVSPDDVDALARALRNVIEDDGRRARLAEASWAAASKLPSWKDSARLFSRALEDALR